MYLYVDVADEIPFLIDCPLYIELRQTLFQSCILINENFLQLDSLSKFIFIMNCKELIQFQLAKTVFDMFRRRKSFMDV